MDALVDEPFIDESPLDEGRTEIPRAAKEALDSWDRTLANLEDPARHRGPKYLDAAKEIWALRSTASPAVAQQLADDIIAMGVRHGMDQMAAENLLQAAIP